MIVRAVCLLVLLLGGSAVGQSGPGGVELPKNAAEWFSRASERMTLRVPGMTPFHLHVTFHAYPGEEMLGAKEKPEIISGDGVYDEVWLEPHKWRREMTLADYHAVEADANGVRKMQASSDYEPSRLVMLLDALYEPISRTLTSKEFHPGSGWKVEPVTQGQLSLVRLSKAVGGAQRADYTESHYFFPKSGALAMSNDISLVTIWSDDVTFGSKIVPGGLTVRCGERELLTAKISIEAAGNADEGKFELPGSAAEPGMTLRPLHWNEIRRPDLSDSWMYMSNQPGRAPVFAWTAQVDRHGQYREVEVLLAPNPRDADQIIAHFRGLKKKPATIDGSPCQFRLMVRNL